jgi:hypothetical protein
MKLTTEMLEDFKDIEELREALVSSDMYTFNHLYNILCLGMESGKIRGMNLRTKHVGLPDMLSISYEAHFRCELHWTMSTQGYRHSYSKEALKYRAKRFMEVYQVVKRDRARHTASAWKARRIELKHAGTYQASELQEDATESGGVDFADDEF